MKQKPLILAIETSGRIGSVAIASGEQILSQIHFSGLMRHSAEIFPAVNSLLNRFGQTPREIEHIYLSVGPGSFTGLRIAVALAKTMHLANAVKIVTVNTLDAIAANATDWIKEKNIKDTIKIATILDAKRGQFFIALYQNKKDKWEKLIPDCLMTARQFLEKFAGNSQQYIWMLGEGLVYYKSKFEADGIHFIDEPYWSPQAEKVHSLGWEKALAEQFANPLTLKPAYLQRPDIKQKQ